MGRNMFGTVRREWDLDWRGWWGDDPPYPAPEFVLTHHPRDPVTMRGGTTFTFVTAGINCSGLGMDCAWTRRAPLPVSVRQPSQAVPPGPPYADPISVVGSAFLGLETVTRWAR